MINEVPSQTWLCCRAAVVAGRRNRLNGVWVIHEPDIIEWSPSFPLLPACLTVIVAVTFIDTIINMVKALCIIHMDRLNMQHLLSSWMSLGCQHHLPSFDKHKMVLSLLPESKTVQTFPAEFVYCHVLLSLLPPLLHNCRHGWRSGNTGNV